MRNTAADELAAVVEKLKIENRALRKQLGEVARPLGKELKKGDIVQFRDSDCKDFWIVTSRMTEIGLGWQGRLLVNTEGECYELPLDSALVRIVDGKMVVHESEDDNGDT